MVSKFTNDDILCYRVTNQFCVAELLIICRKVVSSRTASRGKSTWWRLLVSTALREKEHPIALVRGWLGVMKRIDHRLLTTLYQLQRLFCVEWYVRMITLDDLLRIGYKSAVAYLKLLSPHSPTWTEENHETSQDSGCPSLDSSRMQVWSSTARFNMCVYFPSTLTNTCRGYGLRYYPDICREGLRRTTKTWQDHFLLNTFHFGTHKSPYHYTIRKLKQAMMCVMWLRCPQWINRMSSELCTTPENSFQKQALFTFLP